MYSVFVSLFCAGVVSLVLELSLLREFVYVFGATSASNAFIISLYLSGLVAGSYAGTWKTVRIRNDGDARAKFALLQLATIAFIAVFFATKKYFIYDCPVKNIVRLYFLLSVVCPAVLSGLAYALSVKIMHAKGEKAVTRIYAVSTAGSVAGGLAHGLYLVPSFGMTSTYACAVVFAALSLFLMHHRMRAQKKLFVLICVTAVLALLYLRPAKKLFDKAGVRFSSDSEFGIVELWDMPPSQAAFHNERIGGTAHELDPARTYVDFKINNIHQGYSLPSDYRIHCQWAETSLALVNRPAGVLLFGYGSGVTAAAFLASAQTAGIDIIENCAPIIEAGKIIFPAEFRLVAEDARAQLIADDFRGHIRFTHKTYDIIAIDHSLRDPYQAGFFTLDFFELVKKRLKPGGIVLLLGDGISWNTTKLSFPWIYKSADPAIEAHLRKNCLYLSMTPLVTEAAGRYRLVERPLEPGGPVYADDIVARAGSAGSP